MADKKAVAVAGTANPAPLGLMGFGMTTVLLNIHNAGFYPMDSMILAMGIFYGGIAQIIAGIMEWKKGNTFATTAFISYGSFWLTLAGLIVMPKLVPGILGPGSDRAFTAYLTMWGLFTFVLFIGTLKINGALQTVFGSLVVLFFNEVPSHITKIAKEAGLTSVQLHGEEIPEFCASLAPLTVIKGIRVRDDSDIKMLSAYSFVSAYLLDSFVKGKKGGTGKTFDWKLALLAKKYGKPLILSGGLTPLNILEALKKVEPYGVDVSSGVESKPGKKDKKKLIDFIRKVRQYDAG